mmetsp:Transcript_41590/g.129608  ORF Transcript_41590/g.129608 Transcript_41590/m.129608 type:complete len:249 (+) Transcript_41590:415-1161(+)
MAVHGTQIAERRCLDGEGGQEPGLAAPSVEEATGDNQPYHRQGDICHGDLCGHRPVRHTCLEQESHAVVFGNLDADHLPKAHEHRRPQQLGTVHRVAEKPDEVLCVAREGARAGSFPQRNRGLGSLLVVLHAHLQDRPCLLDPPLLCEPARGLRQQRRQQEGHQREAEAHQRMLPERHAGERRDGEADQLAAGLRPLGEADEQPAQVLWREFRRVDRPEGVGAATGRAHEHAACEEGRKGRCCEHQNL